MREKERDVISLYVHVDVYHGPVEVRLGSKLSVYELGAARAKRCLSMMKKAYKGL